MPSRIFSQRQLTTRRRWLMVGITGCLKQVSRKRNTSTNSMSKQSKAKEKQGYVPKAKPQTCMNCKHFTHEKILMKTPWSSYTKDTNLRCTLGGFKVMKMGMCNEWSMLERQRADR